MSWAGIASNQTVTFNNLKNAVDTGVFTAKTTIPTTQECITKTDAYNYVNINTAYGPYAAKASNQLVTKSNLQACATLPYSHIILYESQESAYYGWSSSGAACAANENELTVYSSSSNITAGAALYLDSCGTEQLNATAYNSSWPYFKYGGNYITFEDWDATGYGYVVRSVNTCAEPLPDVYVYGQANYPVTGGNSTITQYVWNNTNSVVYLKLVFNSGGVSSGSIPSNTDVLAVYLSSIVSISVTGTITGFGTTLFSSSYITIAPNSAPYFYIDKFDGFGSGSTLRIYYSFDLVNYSPVSVVFP